MDLEKLAIEYVDFIESAKAASEVGSGVSLMGEYGALSGAVAILGRVNTLRGLSDSAGRAQRWERFAWHVEQERRRRAYAERPGANAADFMGRTTPPE
jgi:hypothetical protein